MKIINCKIYFYITLFAIILSMAVYLYFERIANKKTDDVKKIMALEMIASNIGKRIIVENISNDGIFEMLLSQQSVCSLKQFHSHPTA